jgi:outer membrane protein TolC
MLALLFLGLAGCVRYKPSPVSDEEMLSRIAQRSLGTPELIRFAERMAETKDEGAVRYDPADGLALAEAEVALLFLSPDLATVRARIGIADAVASTAGRLDDPVFSIEATRLLENASSSPNPWDSRVGLGFVVPLSGRLGVEKDLAEAQTQEARAQYLVAQREKLQELRHHWLEYSEAAAATALLESFLEDLREIRALSQRLAEQGVIPRTEARLLLIELLDREAEHRDLLASKDMLRRELLWHIGVPASTEVDLVPTLKAPEPIEADEQLLVERHPTLAAMRLRLAAAEQAFRLEVRRQYPDLSLGPIGAEEDDLWRLGFGVSLPLPVWNKNAQRLAEAKATRDAAHAEYEAALVASLAEVSQLRARTVASEERLRFLREEMTPVVTEQIEETRRLAELGSLDVLLLREALSMSYETSARLLTAQREKAQLRWTLASHLSPPLAIPTSENESRE